ncbi:MAG: prolipoprotein diacylglyceryl transferase family protein, partial [Planctomycetota bacterium]
MLDIIVDFGVLEMGGWKLPLRVHGYGFMLVLGFLLGIALAQWRTRRMGENPEAMFQCGILALIGGILGSRIAYIIQHWDRFSGEPNPIAAMLNLTSGGLIYYGGVVLAIALVLGYLWIKKLPIRRYLDVLAVSLMIGLA